MGRSSLSDRELAEHLAHRLNRADEIERLAKALVTYLKGQALYRGKSPVTGECDWLPLDRIREYRQLERALEEKKAQR
jgi:hypothetical protein